MTDNKNETQRRRLAPDQKIAILKAHLVDKKPISDLCDQQGIQPSQFYRWQQEFFERGSVIFESSRRKAFHRPGAQGGRPGGETDPQE
jgi:transposase-like protein